MIFDKFLARKPVSDVPPKMEIEDIFDTIVTRVVELYQAGVIQDPALIEACGLLLEEQQPAAASETKLSAKALCQACGEPNETGSKFCAHCGATIVAEMPVVTQPVVEIASGPTPQTIVPEAKVPVPPQTLMQESPAEQIDTRSPEVSTELLVETPAARAKRALLVEKNSFLQRMVTRLAPEDQTERQMPMRPQMHSPAFTSSTHPVVRHIKINTASNTVSEPRVISPVEKVIAIRTEPEAAAAPLQTVDNSASNADPTVEAAPTLQAIESAPATYIEPRADKRTLRPVLRFS